MKKAITTGLKTGAKNFIIPAIDILVTQRPEFTPHWLLVRGFFGSLFDLEQERINEIVELLNNNEEAFAKSIVKTKEFEEGFVITFEQYLKQRSERKRRVIQRIFLGFTSNSDKKNFELERMYNILSMISFEGIKYIEFLIDKIFPFRENELKRLSVGRPEPKKWIENEKKYNSLSNHINGWLYKEYNANSLKAKCGYDFDGKDKKIFEKINKEEARQLQYNREMLAELLSLGIVRISGTNSNEYTMTSFGYDFIKFIKDEK